MSHSKLRKENNCLNCDAIVDGRYCKNCGQENVEPKQSLWHLVTHFFNDITHFDGKFFSTMKSLILKPGFLSAEYVKGRRMKYLDPIRMYLFISAAFFIVMLSLSEKPHYIYRDTDAEEYRLIDSMRIAFKDSVEGVRGGNIDGKNVMILSLDDMYIHGIAHYDSVQRTLPDSAKSDWFDRWGEHNMIAVYSAYNSDPYNFFARFIEKFFHSLSKIFFISLPIFALFLYLLYIRRRQQYYFVSHAIFALHYYCLVFFFLLIPFFISNRYYNNDSAFEIMYTLVAIGLFVYLYIAMLRFYKQHWFKTFIKFSVLSLSTVVLVLIIVLGLLVNSFFAMGAAH